MNEERYDGLERDVELEQKEGPKECAGCKMEFEADALWPCAFCDRDYCDPCYAEHVEKGTNA